VKSSDLVDKKTLRENKEAMNDTRVRNLLIANEMRNPLSALECAMSKLFAKSSDVPENKWES
jgi:hypothetical protein